MPATVRLEAADLGLTMRKSMCWRCWGRLEVLLISAQLRKLAPILTIAVQLLFPNLKKSADTLLYMQEHGLDTEEYVSQVLKEATVAMQEAQTKVKELDAEMKAIRVCRQQ